MINITTLNVTQEILNLIAEIDEFKGAWRALKTLAPERLNALRHVATIESIGSSTRIEGSKLSNSDVEKLLSNLQIKTFNTRDEQEVAGYAGAMKLIFQSWEDINLTENHIKQLHSELLKYSEKDTGHRGHYKTSSNNVVAFDENGRQAGIVFETATPFNTPRLMSDIVVWTNDMLSTKSLHPLLITSVFIVVFLEIHPFQDGNGRLSRILTTLLLLHSGYAYVPYGSLESIIEQSKESYYIALRQTQGTIRTSKPNWQAWIIYFLKVLVRQTRNLAKKVESQKMILAKLPKLSLQILDYTEQHGRATMFDIIKLTNISRNTLKEHFRTLIKKGYLVLRGKGRGSWYELP